jgi:glycerophosphoryl diester phosphodiesterase
MLRLSVISAAILVLGTAAGASARDFDIEAHRGGRGLRPENTLQSFANALSSSTWG